MPQVHKSCVNMCGQAFPVYDSGRNQIGEILPREYFVVIGGEGGLCALYFMNPSGIMVTGYIRSWEVPYKLIYWAEKRAGGYDYITESGDLNYRYGFVDSGMQQGTGPGNIALYGNW